MEIYEILDGRLYQSGAPEDAAEWESIHARGIDVVVDLYGTLDPGVPTTPNSILFAAYLEALPAPAQPRPSPAAGGATL